MTGTIDFHAHVLDPDVYARTINHNVITAFGARPQAERPAPSDPRFAIYARMTDRALHTSDMDRRGVQMHVISIATTSQGSGWADASEATRLDHASNTDVAAWVDSAPDRFAGAFTLPLQDLKAALGEFERATQKLRLRIVNLPASIDGRYIGDKGFKPLWSAIAQSGVVAFIHPDGVRDPWFQDYSMWNGIGQGIEETRAMASLIYNGTLDDHPDVAIVMAHGGGYLPFYIGRLDRNATAHPASIAGINGIPSDYLRRFYYDTCVYDPWVVRGLAERIGVDRLLLGSDYPVGEKDPLAFLRRCGFDSDEMIAITRTNAQSLLDGAHITTV